MSLEQFNFDNIEIRKKLGRRIHVKLNDNLKLSEAYEIKKILEENILSEFGWNDEYRNNYIFNGQNKANYSPPLVKGIMYENPSYYKNSKSKFLLAVIINISSYYKYF